MKIKNAFQIGLLGGLGVLLALVIGQAVGQVSTILLYTFAAIFLALGIDPVIQFLMKHRFPRWAAVLTTVLVIVGALVGAMFIIIPVIVGQTITLVNEVIQQINHGALEDVKNWVVETFPFIKLDDLIAQVTTAVQNPQTWADVPPYVLVVAEGIFGAFGQMLIAFGGVFIVVVLMLYFTGSLPAIKSGMYRLVPASSRPKFIEIAEQIMKSVGRFVTGQFTLGLINGVLSFILLSIVGAKLAAVYAFIAFLASTIPLIGTISASVIISLLVLLLDGPQTALPVAIYYLVYMQVEAYLVSPQIMNKAVKVPGVVVVIAALTGGTLLGILGALVAIPVAAAIQLILKEVVIPRQDLR